MIVISRRFLHTHQDAARTQNPLVHVPGSRSVGRELFSGVRLPQMNAAILASNQALEGQSCDPTWMFESV